MSFCSSSLHAQSPAQDKINVRDALVKWRDAFNAGDGQHVCDLFSPDLIWATLYPAYKNNIKEKNFDTICEILQRTITDKRKQYHYSLHIKEIIVSNDLAVVRVVWTLQSISKLIKKLEITREHSLDIMKKQPDGKTWKMIRFVAYEVS